MKTLAEFYNGEGKRLLSFIRSRTDNSEDAEDILGEVFLKALEAPNVLAPIENLGAWFYTAAKRRVIDLYRRRARRSGHEEIGSEGSDLDLIASDYGFNAPEELERKLVEDALEAALEALPEKQREVFIQNELEGMTFRQIAEETGVSINTLMARKRYAVLFLRKRLAAVKQVIDSGGVL